MQSLVASAACDRDAASPVQAALPIEEAIPRQLNQKIRSGQTICGATRGPV